MSSSDKNSDITQIKKIFWIDLEMTGLQPETDVIIEVAVIITDSQFKELETYENVVYQDQKHLDGMDSWNQKCHRRSGLYDLIPKGKQLVQVENDLLSLTETHFNTDEKIVISGNCVYQDRNFIRRYMSRLDKKLYYRMLDVTAFKLIAQQKGYVFEKENKHRALEDIRESIRELKYYLENMSFKKT